MMEAVDNAAFDVQQIQTFLIGLGGGGALGVITGAALKVRSLAFSHTRTHICNIAHSQTCCHCLGHRLHLPPSRISDTQRRQGTWAGG